MNQFGGFWTENKIDILVDYARAYLTIMNKYAKMHNWNLMYFDGFAGSGMILNKLKDETGQSLIFESEKQITEITIGAARRILEIDEPMPFDEYYFVEKDSSYYTSLKENTVKKYLDKKIYVVNEDCNQKMIAMGDYLRTEGKNSKVLAYIDPCGMQVNWDSLVALSNVSIDMWILVPTGMGINRLLVNGKISDSWIGKLQKFLGLSESELLDFFYFQNKVQTLFGDEKEVLTKREKAIFRSGDLYRMRLGEIFKHVSEPYILKTKSNNVLYHFLMVSNNKTAVNIANEIIKKWNLNPKR